MRAGSEAAANARLWVAEGDGRHRCTKHNETFTLPRTCTKCDADPARVSTQEPAPSIPKAPKGCQTSEQLERWFVEMAKEAAADAGRLAKLANAGKSKKKRKKSQDDEDDFDFHVDANRVKYLEVALKFGRAATQLALQREDARIVWEREKRLRELGAGAEH